MHIRYWSFLIGVLLSALGFSQTPNELFEKGNKAYLEGKYDSALVCYKQIENQGLYSVELYQNTGTAAFKSGEIATAIYYFEKGLKQHPSNKDLEHNLQLAEKQLTDVQVIKSSTGFSGWLSHLVGHTADFWSKWSMYLSIAGAFTMVLGMILKKHKNWFFLSGSILWLLTIFCYSFAAVQGHNLSKKEYAIVFEPTTNIKNEPSEMSTTSFVLHEGSKVILIDQVDDWTKIDFGDNKVGWIKTNHIKVI